jgi:hypothetical protein
MPAEGPQFPLVLGLSAVALASRSRSRISRSRHDGICPPRRSSPASFPPLSSARPQPWGRSGRGRRGAGPSPPSPQRSGACRSGLGAKKQRRTKAGIGGSRSVGVLHENVPSCRRRNDESGLCRRPVRERSVEAGPSAGSCREPYGVGFQASVRIAGRNRSDGRGAVAAIGDDVRAFPCRRSRPKRTPHRCGRRG